MSSTLRDQIKASMIAAMRSKESQKLVFIRSLQAEIKKKEIETKTVLDDAQIVSIIQQSIKKCRDSVEQYEAGNRPELAAKEKDEISVLTSYLPPPLSEEELDTLAQRTIQQSQASSIKDMSKVVKLLKEQVKGRANTSDIAAIVKKHLSE